MRWGACGCFAGGTEAVMKSWVFCAGVLLTCGASNVHVAQAFGVDDKAPATTATTARTDPSSGDDASSKNPKTAASPDSAADTQPASTTNSPASDAAPAPVPPPAP